MQRVHRAKGMCVENEFCDINDGGANRLFDDSQDFRVNGGEGMGSISRRDISIPLAPANRGPDFESGKRRDQLPLILDGLQQVNERSRTLLENKQLRESARFQKVATQ